MILTIDIGNSNVCVGVYDGQRLMLSARAKTDPLLTDTECAIFLMDVFELNSFNKAHLDGAAISSVVPALTGAYEGAVRLLKRMPVITVGPGVKTGINLRIDEPASVGADLVCTAVGAANRYPLPAIIIDLGTATKITVVTDKKDFIAGAILPGVIVSLSALARSTAQLPSIGISGGRIKAIGSNTVDCMRSGSVLGTASMIDGMIERFKAELGGDVPTVVACGGLVDGIIPYCKSEITINKNLLLEGLLEIYRKNS